MVHYHADRNVFEEKPANYTNFGEIRKYKITFAQHSHDYQLYNAEKFVDYFLPYVKTRIGRSSNDSLIKCGFSSEHSPVSYRK